MADKPNSEFRITNSEFVGTILFPPPSYIVKRGDLSMDEIALRRAQRGDENAFEALVTP